MCWWPCVVWTIRLVGKNTGADTEQKNIIVFALISLELSMHSIRVADRQTRDCNLNAIKRPGRCYGKPQYE